MGPRAAEILAEECVVDGRAALRWRLQLRVSLYTSDQATSARILNISEAGVLIETVLDLEMDEVLQVDLPEASGSTAQVVWREGFLAGCKFIDTLPRSAVSAARLMSPNEALAEIGEGHPPTERSYSESPDRGGETAVAIVASIIAVLSLIIFVAALLTSL